MYRLQLVDDIMIYYWVDYANFTGEHEKGGEWECSRKGGKNKIGKEIWESHCGWLRVFLYCDTRKALHSIPRTLKLPYGKRIPPSHDYITNSLENTLLTPWYSLLRLIGSYIGCGCHWPSQSYNSRPLQSRQCQQQGTCPVSPSRFCDRLW